MKKDKIEKVMKKLKNVKKILLLITICLLTISSNVYATDDPLTAVNNLSDFMFSIVRVVGSTLTVWGLVQFGLALKSHDPSQRANSFFSIVGGLIITFSKEILNIIIG